MSPLGARMDAILGARHNAEDMSFEDSRSSWLSASLLLALVTSSFACGGPLRDAHVAGASDAGVPTASRESAASPAPDSGRAAPRAAMDREIARLADYHTWFGFQTQAKPAHFRPLPAQASAPFPGVKFAAVRAYTFRFDNGALGVDPCVVAPDGTLCASVNTPGTALSDAQVKKLLSIVPELSPAGRSTEPGRVVKRPASHCQFDPHHAFVFFDAEGRPVGELEVCLSCGQLSQTPKVADLGGDLFSEEVDAFRAVCGELGLGGCFLGTPAYEDRRPELPPVRARSLGPPTENRALPVAGDRLLAATSEEEKRRLCLWYANEAAATEVSRRTSRNDPMGFKCPSGEEGTFTWLDGPSCLARFPRCEASVEAVSACVKWRLSTGLCPDPNAATDPCAELNACTWGVRRDVRVRARK